jgi:hypothetical protein
VTYVKALKKAAAANAKHPVNLLAKQAVVLQINLAKTKNK